MVTLKGKTEFDAYLNPKWLKKTPNSITDLWKIMEEAKALYEIKKRDKKEANIEYEQKLFNAEIYVGTIVTTKDTEQLRDMELKIISIRRNIVHVKVIKSGHTFKLRNFDFKKVKK